MEKLLYYLINVQTASPIETSDVSSLPSGASSFIRVLVHSVQQSGPFGKLILLILMVFSIVSWAIILERWKYFRSQKTTTKNFLGDIWASRILSMESARWSTYNKSPLAHLYRTACLHVEKRGSLDNKQSTSLTPVTPRPINLEVVEREFDKTIGEQIMYMEKYLSFLATTASATPFIGLLGTVWGILATFYQMGLSGSANFTTIAPGLAEALIATAAGLAAAIPAVIAYNHFATKIRRITSQMYQFSSELLNHIEEHHS